MEAFEDVRRCLVFLRELALIDTLTVFQDETYVSQNDVPQGGGIFVFLKAGEGDVSVTLSL